jgi:hypothetical protein
VGSKQEEGTEMTRKIAAAVVGAAVAAAGAAYAVAGDEGHQHGGRGDRAAMLERFDTNKDGQLDDQEREAARAARKAEMLQRFDKDKDGQLSESERDAMRSEMHDKHDRQR